MFACQQSSSSLLCYISWPIFLAWPLTVNQCEKKQGPTCETLLHSTTSRQKPHRLPLTNLAKWPDFGVVESQLVFWCQNTVECANSEPLSAQIWLQVLNRNNYCYLMLFVNTFYCQYFNNTDTTTMYIAVTVPVTLLYNIIPIVPLTVAIITHTVLLRLLSTFTLVCTQFYFPYWH